MLRGFRQPYHKLFDGEVFTTVRVLRDSVKEAARVGTTDTIFVFPRTPRMTKLGRAQIVAIDIMHVDVFKRRCTEEFARYDAEKTAAELVKSIERQCRKTGRQLVGVFTYLWIEKTDEHERYVHDFKAAASITTAEIYGLGENSSKYAALQQHVHRPTYAKLPIAKKPTACPKGGEHDFTATFEGGDTYRCTKCGHKIDMTED